MAAGAGDARHLIVDAYQEHFHASGWAAIAGAGLADLCSLVQERSQIALPRLLGDGFVANAAPRLPTAKSSDRAKLRQLWAFLAWARQADQVMTTS